MKYNLFYHLYEVRRDYKKHAMKKVVLIKTILMDPVKGICIIGQSITHHISSFSCSCDACA